MVCSIVAVLFYEGGRRFADENYLMGLLLTSIFPVVIGIFLTREAIKKEEELERQQRELERRQILERRQRSEEELERRQRSSENMKTGGKADG